MRSPDSRVFLPALASIRGVAAWYIVLYHFREYIPDFGFGAAGRVLDRGYLAVDLFFVLSGFVIALNYLDSLNEPGPIGIRIGRFLWLRLGRIYPLHITVLVLMTGTPMALWIFSAHGFSGGRYNPGYFLLSIFLVQNWGFANGLAWNIPAWSISAEWFVYLIFPAMAWTLHRLPLRPAAWAGCVLAVAFFLAVAWAACAFTPDSSITQGGLLRCAGEFLMGTCVYRFWYSRFRFGLPYHGNAAFCGALALVAAYAALSLPDFTVMPLCFALLIYALADGRSVAARAMRWPVLEWLGLVSYSTYMLHYLIRDWVKLLLIHTSGTQPLATAAYLCATGLLSAVFFRVVEVPGRRWFRTASLATGRPFYTAANR